MIEVLSIYKKDFIKKFWVGLMDGDGSIQVNHWRKNSLQFRLVIKLAPLQSNENMLKIISTSIGGIVRYNFKQNIKDSVLWIVNDKKKFINIIEIFSIYKPLTSRLICQLNFAKNCLLLSKNNINWYFENRNLKYEKQSFIVSGFVAHFDIPDYFSSWVVGFIEAEGCFCIRKSFLNSFSIGQNDDVYLLSAIKNYFEGTNTIRKLNNNFYLWEVYKKSVLLRIINHCSNIDHPLIGAKFDSLNSFINIIN